MFITAAHTDKGIKKPENQDGFCIEKARTSYGDVLMAVLCDGVGGYSGGNLASASVISAFTQWFNEDCADFLGKNDVNGQVNLDELRRVWGRLIADMNTAICDYGRTNGIRLGTTCTACFSCQGRLFIAHVGDCRVYEFTVAGFNVITEDQTLVAQEIAKGNIRPEEAETHPKRNVILQSVGTQPDVSPVYYQYALNPNAIYMMCSDGFRHVLAPAELHQAFRPLLQANTQQITQTLVNMVELVKSRGENDNITTLAFRFQAGEGESAACAVEPDTYKAITPSAVDDDDAPTVRGN